MTIHYGKDGAKVVTSFCDPCAFTRDLSKNELLALAASDFEQASYPENAPLREFWERNGWDWLIHAAIHGKLK